MASGMQQSFTSAHNTPSQSSNFMANSSRGNSAVDVLDRSSLSQMESNNIETTTMIIKVDAVNVPSTLKNGDMRKAHQT